MVVKIEGDVRDDVWGFFGEFGQYLRQGSYKVFMQKVRKKFFIFVREIRIVIIQSLVLERIRQGN